MTEMSGLHRRSSAALLVHTGSALLLQPAFLVLNV
jgi:hypothetical protein